MKLITFISGDSTVRMKRYADSAAAFGLHPIYFQTPFYPGHVGRCQAMLPTLVRWDEDEIVCFTDCYDVLFLAGEKEILERYQRLGCPDVCLSAERDCYPYQWQKEEFPEVAGPYRYINAGCWIGRAGAMVELWSRAHVLRLPSSHNDQAALADLYRQYPQAIMLDSRAVLFQNLWSAVADLDYGSGMNRITGTQPALIHASGGADITGAERLLKERIRNAHTRL